MEELLKRYKELNDECNKYNYASYIISYDESTACPIKGKEQANDVMNYLEKR